MVIMKNRYEIYGGRKKIWQKIQLYIEKII